MSEGSRLKKLNIFDGSQFTALSHKSADQRLQNQVLHRSEDD